MHSLWKFVGSTWKFFGSTKNQKILSWIGAGLLATFAALAPYVWPRHESGKVVCAQQGVAVGGDVSGAPVANHVKGVANSGPCIGPKR